MKGDTMKEHLKALQEVHKAIWAHVGQDPMEYNLKDMTDNPWRKDMRGFPKEVSWWDPGEVIDIEEGGYGSEIYGTSLWAGETHTIAVMDDGYRDAYVFLNSKEIKEG